MNDDLNGAGVGISLDDFGTGYSSLSYLHRFPVDTLKVDRSFVSCMSDHNENAEIVRTIVVLARNLGMKVVAEGVEPKDQQAHLRALDCEYGQGYLYSKPLAAANAGQFLTDSFTYHLNASEAQDSTILQHGLAA